MPFKSKSQARALFRTNPKVAKEFARETPNYKDLPERLHPRKKRKPKKK